MLKIRAFSPNDLELVKQLHYKYYSEFSFPDFMKDFVNAFVIEDENDEVVLAGGVEVIAEIVLVTNKEKSRIKIGRALIEAQSISLYTCRHYGIKELHAFVNNEDYARHLIRHGFRPRSTALSMRLHDGEEQQQSQRTV